MNIKRNMILIKISITIIMKNKKNTKNVSFKMKTVIQTNRNIITNH